MVALRRIGIIAIPGTFLFAGAGMLWLYVVESSDGTFFQQINRHAADWNGAHLLLLASAMLMLPAALSMRSAIHRRAAGVLATVMVMLIGPTAILLAGQYAIDFVVPLMAQVGGDAQDVHSLLSATPLVFVLFYGLPNLVFLAMMGLSVALVWGGAMARVPAAILLLNWAAVLLGNLVHPLFQRTAILLLALSLLPLLPTLWRGTVVDNTERQRRFV